MAKRNRVPAWYRLFIEREIAKRETALACLDSADFCIKVHMPMTANLYYEKAKAAIA
jgi:hypothetical protein